MNDSQRRRQELLRQTREKQHDHRIQPAVHPRYENTYQYLYEEGVADKDFRRGGTFGIRVILCVLVFAVFLMLHYEDEKLLPFDYENLENQICTDLNITELWKKL